jgi:hypothetical protein
MYDPSLLSLHCIGLQLWIWTFKVILWNTFLIYVYDLWFSSIILISCSWSIAYDLIWFWSHVFFIISSDSCNEKPSFNQDNWLKWSMSFIKWPTVRENPSSIPGWIFFFILTLLITRPNFELLMSPFHYEPEG